MLPATNTESLRMIECKLILSKKLIRKLKQDMECIQNSIENDRINAIGDPYRCLSYDIELCDEMINFYDE